MKKKPVIELLVNTKSRRGRVALPTLLAACETANLPIRRVHKMKDPSRLGATITNIKKRSPDLLIIASGDGTLSGAVHYLANTDIELGVIPLGTTNNFARSIGIPLDLHHAVRVIKNGKSHPIDLGQIGSKYFANVAGIGLSARLAQSVTAKRKKRYGRLAYAITGLLTLLKHKPFMVQLADKDGELQMYFETHQVIVANGRYHAGTEIAASAKLDSRELVIFKLGNASRLNFLWHMLDFYFGKRKSVYHSAYFIGRNVTIHTGSPQPIELDGEVRLNTPVTAEVHSKAIKVRF